MKRPGAPIGNGPDLLELVVTVVLVAFMLTLVAQMRAAGRPSPPPGPLVAAAACRGLPVPVATRTKAPVARPRQAAWPCGRGPAPLPLLAFRALSAR